MNECPWCHDTDCCCSDFAPSGRLKPVFKAIGPQGTAKEEAYIERFIRRDRELDRAIEDTISRERGLERDD